jgi:acetate kinase
MLKESIYVWVEELGEKEFDSIHKLVKEYFRLWIDRKIGGFNEITYRGHKLLIHDDRGFTDAIKIEEDIASQITKINKELDGE